MYSLTLRAKAIIIGVLVAGALSFVASLSTYFLAREYLLRQRDAVAVTQVLAATRLASSALVQGGDPLEVLQTSAQVVPGSRAVLYRDGLLLVSGVGLTQTDIPKSLLEKLKTGVPASQRTEMRSEMTIAVGIPMTNYTDTWFIGIVSLRELEASLTVLRLSLTVGATLALIGGGVVGGWLSRRVMEPLRDISAIAQEISLGDLTKRAKEPREPDLARIANSFNAMTASLRKRIEREMRFGATVSHELRSPLTVIRSATDLIASKRDELPPHLQMSSDLLNVRVAAFERIVNDLIEISRYQSGMVEPRLEELSVRSLVETMSSRKGVDLRLLELDDATVVVDIRRFQQIFENLHNNAVLYADGIEAIRGFCRGSVYELNFDDLGIGISDADRGQIFEPFVRGAHHSAIPGSGLGLAITLEHARIMNGDVRVGSSPTGGARFTLIMQIVGVKP